jgi:hypothetical protein
MGIGFPLPQRPIPPILGFRGGGYGPGLGFQGSMNPALYTFDGAALRILNAGQARTAAEAARSATWLPLLQAGAAGIVAQGLVSLENVAEVVKEMAGQAWGYLDRPRVTDQGFKPPRALPNQSNRGNYSATGQTRIDCSYTFTYFLDDGTIYSSDTYNFQWTYTGVKGAYFWADYMGGPVPYYSRLSFIKADGSEFDDPGIFGGGGSPPSKWTISAAFTFTALDTTGEPIEGNWGTGYNPQPIPYAPGRLIEVETAQPLPSKPAPMPAYLPGLDPAAVPNAVPVKVPQTKPGEEVGSPGRPVIAPPIAPPITPTQTPVSPVRAPRVARPLGPNGQQLPIPFPRPTPTPVDNHYVNGQPITTGQPRTDLESIAKEVGRIESKTAKSLEQMAGPAGALDKLLDLLDLLERIAGLLDATTPGGEFQITGPCDLDENKNRIVHKVPFAGGPVLSRVESKVEALADLLQIHKDLKQPVCTFRNPNSNVTVTFTEVLDVYS